jgi:hypothetical protein
MGTSCASRLDGILVLACFLLEAICLGRGARRDGVVEATESSRFNPAEYVPCIHGRSPVTDRNASLRSAYSAGPCCRTISRNSSASISSAPGRPFVDYITIRSFASRSHFTLFYQLKDTLLFCMAANLLRISTFPGLDRPHRRVNIGVYIICIPSAGQMLGFHVIVCGIPELYRTGV